MKYGEIKKAAFTWLLNYSFNKAFRGSPTRWTHDELIDQQREHDIADKVVNEDVWMYACESTIASSLARLPLSVYKQKPQSKGAEWEPQENHSISQLLLNPNDYWTQFEFMVAAAFMLEHHGEVFIEKAGVKKQGDIPASLHLFAAQQVRVIPHPTDFVDHYSVNVGGGLWKPFKRHEIIWLRYFNPTNMFEGFPASTPAGTSIKQHLKAGRWAEKFFDNNCVPFGVVETDRRLPEPEYERIRKQLAKSHKNEKNWWKLMILEGGLKYKNIQMTPKDLSMKEFKTHLKHEIFSAYGVNEAVIGSGEKMNNAIMKELLKQFWIQTMTPKALQFAQRLSKDLLAPSELGKTKIMFDFTSVEALQEDQEIKSRIAFNLQKSMVMVPDEIRKIFYKMKPLSGGIGAHVYIPANMVTAEALLNNNGKPLSGGKPDGKPGKPGGPDADSDDEGKKPGSNDGKPAGKDIHLVLEEYKFGEKILVG